MPPIEPDEEPSRADLRLWEQALRQDWPIPPEVKRRLLQVAIDLVDPSAEEDLPSGPEDVVARIDLGAKRDRVKLGALRVIAQFCRLSLLQRQHDLSVRRLDGRYAGASEAEGVDPLAAAAALQAARDSHEHAHESESESEPSHDSQHPADES